MTKTMASLQLFPSSLLPSARSRALIPFPFPFERLPRRLAKLGKGMLSSVEQAFEGRDKNELS